MLQRGVASIGSSVGRSRVYFLSLGRRSTQNSQIHKRLFHTAPFQRLDWYAVPQPPPKMTPDEIESFEKALKQIEETHEDTDVIFTEMNNAWKRFTGLSLKDVEALVPDLKNVDELTCFDILPSDLRKEAIQGHFPDDATKFADRLKQWSTQSQLSEQKIKEVEKMVSWLKDCTSYNFGFACSEPKVEDEEYYDGEEEDDYEDDMDDPSPHSHMRLPPHLNPSYVNKQQKSS